MAQPLNDAALDQLFRTARTYNGYLDKPVTTQQLDAIWELMKFGPTSANCLPARLVWCVSQESKEKLAALTMPANGEKILKGSARGRKVAPVCPWSTRACANSGTRGECITGCGWL